MKNINSDKTAKIRLISGFLVAVVLVSLIVVYIRKSQSNQASATMKKPTNISTTLIEFSKLPIIGVSAAGDTVHLGGFSGLVFHGKDPVSGRLRFITHTDRGPNSEPQDFNRDGHEDRIFVLPNFVPEIIWFDADLERKTLQITKRLPLSDATGNPLSGLPPRPGPSMEARTDDQAFDVFGRELPPSSNGADVEALVVTEDGSFWMGDEYFPSLIQFDSTGTMRQRLIPEKSWKDAPPLYRQVLPERFGFRRVNRGFEAMALQGSELWVFMQSPLDYPDHPKDENSKKSRDVAVLVYDIATQQVTGTHSYLLDKNGPDKIGDAVALGNGKFFILEHGKVDGELVHRIVLQDFKKNRKEIFITLTREQFPFEKAEGLAMVDDRTLVLLNDNDFGIKGEFDLKTGKLKPTDKAEPAAMVVIQW